MLIRTPEQLARVLAEARFPSDGVTVVIGVVRGAAFTVTTIEGLQFEVVVRRPAVTRPAVRTDSPMDHAAFQSTPARRAARA